MALITPKKVLDTTYGEFRKKYFTVDGKRVASLTRAENIFLEHIVFGISDKSSDTSIEDIISVLKTISPKELLSHRDVGVGTIKTLIKIFKEAEIVLSDIPEYEAWDKNTEI